MAIEVFRFQSMQLLQLNVSSFANTSTGASARNVAKHSLKVLARLYEKFGSYDDAVISLCIFGRDADPSEVAASRCNVSTISRLTGIPRETVRRRTKGLHEAGILVLDDKTYRMAPAHAEFMAGVCDALTRPGGTAKLA